LVSRAIEALGLTEDQYADLRRMLPARKTEAVTRYYEITKFGLAEAKAAIDAIEAGVVPGGGPPVSSRPAWEQQAHQGTNASPSEARSITALSALLPAGSRAPTRDEALAIGELAAKGAFDEAALRIGAGWGVDTMAALAIAKRLRVGGNRPAALIFAVALAMALLGAVVAMYFASR
jgi:hypothetical protein